MKDLKSLANAVIRRRDLTTSSAIIKLERKIGRMFQILISLSLVTVMR